MVADSFFELQPFGILSQIPSEQNNSLSVSKFCGWLGRAIIEPGCKMFRKFLFLITTERFHQLGMLGIEFCLGSLEALGVHVDVVV